MPSGTVKWFKGQNGYEFIQPDDGGKDVFVHIIAVERGLTTRRGYEAWDSHPNLLRPMVPLSRALHDSGSHSMSGDRQDDRQFDAGALRQIHQHEIAIDCQHCGEKHTFKMGEARLRGLKD